MKKILSIILAITMVLTSLVFSTTALAEQKSNINKDNCLAVYVDAQIKGAGKYLVSSTTSFNLDSAVDFYTFLKSDALTEAQKNGFVESVSENLKTNSGKLIGAYGENIGTYGATILSLEILGYDAKDFNGYSLISTMEEMDVYSDCHPYYYRFATAVASKEFGKKLIDAYIDQYYTMGQGLDYWGFSCDNTAYFLATIAPFADDYSEYVKDAIAVIDSYKVENGYCYNPMYGTDSNSDSTALAVMAYASVGETKKAKEAYDDLVEQFESKTGVFTYYGEDSAYSTKDALISLEYFAEPVNSGKITRNHTFDNGKVTKASTCSATGIKTYTCTLCGTTKNETINTIAHKPVIDKAVAATYAKAGKTQGSHCSVCNKVITPQKTVAKLMVAAPTNVKVTAKSKGFKATWSKNTKVNGYQVQFSKNKNFSTRKTYTSTKKSSVSRTISGLAKNRTYYVRVRTYKTINGKNYYSNWVTKTVKTK